MNPFTFLIDKQVDKRVDEIQQRMIKSNEEMVKRGQGYYQELQQKNGEIEKLQFEIKTLNNIIKAKHTKIEDKQREVDSKQREIDNKQLEIDKLYNSLYVEDCGMYTDIQQIAFKFSNSEQYQEAIQLNLKAQEEMVVLGTACICSTNWAVGNSLKKGAKMTKDGIAMALRCFNTECGAIIGNIGSRSTYKSIENKIEKSFKAINRLNKVSEITITEAYLELKIELANLVYEQAIKLSEEKAETKRQREILREEEKLAREIEREMEKLNNERIKYEQELQRLIEQQLDNQRVEDLQNKIQELDVQEINLEQRLKNKAGYVYIVSNPLTPNHLKLGVTRRLDPMERIRELSSASLAFKLDVHAIVFSEDAFALESKLHQHFDDKRVNKVSKHKEWFNLSVDEVKEYIHSEIDSTVEFLKVYNEEYEMSKKLN